MAHPRKHAEVIKAWADGAQVQFFSKRGGVWQDVHCPKFDADYEYRVKPELYRYRVALLNDGEFYSLTVESQPVADIWESEGKPNFVRWLTDWIEVEVG